MNQTVADGRQELPQAGYSAVPHCRDAFSSSKAYAFTTAQIHSSWTGSSCAQLFSSSQTSSRAGNCPRTQWGLQIGAQHPARTAHLPCRAQQQPGSGSLSEIPPPSCTSGAPTHRSPTAVHPSPSCLTCTPSTIGCHTKVTEVF